MKNHSIATHVVWFLGIIGIILAVGVVYLTAEGAKIDGGLFTMAGGVVGSLGSLLVNPNNRQANQRQGDALPDGTPDDPVNVTASPESPVATTIADEPSDSPGESPTRVDPLSRTRLKPL